MNLHHLIYQVTRPESRVDGVGGAFDQVPSNGGHHLLVQHEDDDTFVIDASTTGTAGHLDVLAGGDLERIVRMRRPWWRSGC